MGGRHYVKNQSAKKVSPGNPACRHMPPAPKRGSDNPKKQRFPETDPGGDGTTKNATKREKKQERKKKKPLNL